MSRELEPLDHLPLPIVKTPGVWEVVRIPFMTAEAFEFFKQQLEAYKDAIVIPENKEADSAKG